MYLSLGSAIAIAILEQKCSQNVHLDFLVRKSPITWIQVICPAQTATLLGGYPDCRQRQAEDCGYEKLLWYLVLHKQLDALQLTTLRTSVRESYVQPHNHDDTSKMIFSATKVRVVHPVTLQKMVFSATRVRVVHPVGPLTALQKHGVKAGDPLTDIGWLPCLACSLIQTVVNLHRCFFICTPLPKDRLF